MVPVSYPENAFLLNFFVCLTLVDERRGRDQLALLQHINVSKAITVGNGSHF